MELKLSTLRFIIRYFYINEEDEIIDTLESYIDYPVPIPHNQIESVRKRLDIIKMDWDGVQTLISKFNLHPLHFLDEGSSIDIISVNYTFVETPNPISSIISTIVPITYTEYVALSDTDKQENVIYLITDIEPTASKLHVKIQAYDKFQGRYTISIEDIKPIVNIPADNECIKTKERLYDVVQSWYSDIEYITRDDTLVSNSSVIYDVIIDNESIPPSPVSGDNKCTINIAKEFNNPEFAASQIIKKTVELILNRHE